MQFRHIQGTISLTHFNDSAGRRARLDVMGPQGGSWGRVFLVSSQAKKLLAAVEDREVCFSMHTPHDQVMVCAEGQEVHFLFRPLHSDCGWWGFTVDHLQARMMLEACTGAGQGSALIGVV